MRSQGRYLPPGIEARVDAAMAEKPAHGPDGPAVPVPTTPPPTASGTSVAAPAPKPRATVVRGVAFALLSGVLFGVSGTVSKNLMTVYAVDPLWLSAARQLGACLLFFVASAAMPAERAQLRRAVRSPRSLLAMVALGLCGILFSQVGYLEAIDITNAATATVLENCSLLFLLAYTCLTRRKPPLPRETLGVALALAGLFLLATGGDVASLVIPPAGLAWGLAAGLSTAVISILPARPALRGWSSFVVNAFAMLAGGLAVFAAARPWQVSPALDAFGVGSVLFAVVVGTFGAYALYVQAAKDVGPMRAALLATIEPLTALVTSMLWLGQAFSATDLAGFALIMTMVYLTTR